LITFLPQRRQYIPLLCLIAALLNLRLFLGGQGVPESEFFLTVCFVLFGYGLLYASLFWAFSLVSPRLPLAAALFYALTALGRGPEGAGALLEGAPFGFAVTAATAGLLMVLVLTSRLMDPLARARLPRHLLWPFALLCALYAFWGLAFLREAHWLIGAAAHLPVLAAFALLLFLGDRLHVPAFFNWAGLAAALILAVMGMGKHIILEPPPTEVGRGQNFLILTVEGLRHDAVTPEAMPKTAALARRGYLFTGMYGVSPSAGPNLDALFIRRQGSGTAALARLFPERFTRTAFLPPGLAERSGNLDVGFARVRVQGERPFIVRLARAWVPAALFVPPDRLPDEEQVVGEFRALLEGTSRPFLVWMHLDFPARALSPDLIRLVRSGSSVPAAELRSRYDEALRRLDGSLGGLFDWVAARPWADKTNILVVGVSGMELGDHDGAGSGHAYFEESVRFPFLWAGPPVTPGAAPTPIGIVDIFPTLVRAFNLSDKPKAFAGLDITSAFRGVFPADRIFPMADNEAYGPARAVVAGGFKLIQEPGGAFRLYDLAADPLERQDRACAMAARVEQMKGLLP